MSGKDVSDEEAMRALLSAAEARSRERRGGDDDRRRGDGAGRGRWGDRKDRRQDGRSDNRQKRSRFSSSDDRSSSSNNNNNNQRSYYGPSGDDDNDKDRNKRSRNDSNPHNRPRGRETNETIPRVEPDDKELQHNDDGGNNSTDEKPKPQFKPNFGLSGALSKDTQSGNVYKGVVLKFKEPPEARAPNTQWRFYVFKKGQTDVLETLHISKQSAYLMGRNTDIADIPMHHPSLSSQHAVLQYRALPNKEGRLSCQPYIMDLESTNGTFLNGVKIDAARYYQLKKGDVLTFGASTREYVLLTENTTAT
jgi:smad nuclear-interacting protein 1